MKRRTILSAAMAAAFAAGAGIAAERFLHSARFGALPDEAQWIKSPHFRDGLFHNRLPTPVLTGGSSSLEAWVRFFFRDSIDPKPRRALRGVKENLRTLPRDKDWIVWFGHSSFLLNLQGRRLLIDPVFSDYASPVSFANRAFEGTSLYQVSDLPDIDCVLISHDHWDHLDYPSLSALKEKTKLFLVPLGVEAHLLRWGVAREAIMSLDWEEHRTVAPGLRITATEARHYSGRSFEQNKSLWCGWLIESDRRKVFYSGDSGYGPHFKELSHRYGRIDLALIDSGQYNPSWAYIHMPPQEAFKAAQDLGARYVIAAHVGRFSLAPHPWYEPFEQLSQAPWNGQKLLTPKIGEALMLEHPAPTSAWWKAFI